MSMVVLTNDDGIDSPGLWALAEALGDLCDLAVIAPLHNQSAVSHSITLRRALEVHERSVPGAGAAWAVDGTPADCVRLATLGLAGDELALIVSGANLGLNLGDDIAYSGTAAAAMEAAFNGLPAIAVSQQTTERELGFPRSDRYDFELAQLFVRRLVEIILDPAAGLDQVMLGREESTGADSDVDAALTGAAMLNVNVPGISPADAQGVRITQPCRRFYRDDFEEHPARDGVRSFRVYGHEPMHCERPDTDAVAVRDGYVSVTPVRQRFDDAPLRERLQVLHGLHWHEHVEGAGRP